MEAEQNYAVGMWPVLLAFSNIHVFKGFKLGHKKAVRAKEDVGKKAQERIQAKLGGEWVRQVADIFSI